MVLTRLEAVVASYHISRAVLGHMLALTVAAFHGLRTISDSVATTATRADQRLRAFVDIVALTTTIAATNRTGVRTVLAHVTLLLADAAFAGEHARIRAIGLVVTVCRAVSRDLPFFRHCMDMENREYTPELVAVEAGAIFTMIACIFGEATKVVAAAAKVSAWPKAAVLLRAATESAASIGSVEGVGSTITTPVVASAPRHFEAQKLCCFRDCDRTCQQGIGRRIAEESSARCTELNARSRTHHG